jgi:hypothetical protein
MAGIGPAPKGAAQRRRRNKAAPVMVLTADGKVRGPELPDDFEWPDVTREWWETWRTSAQAARFTGTDWSFRIETAVLHADFWLGDLSVAGELRLREAKLGATPADRARLRIAVGEPDAPSALVVKLRRDRTRPH